MPTTQLEIDYLADGQNQAELAVNEMIDIVDAYSQLAVEDRNAVTPPGSITHGNRYHLGAAPTGVWATHGGKIAVAVGTEYKFATPKEGWRMRVKNEDLTFDYDGSTWKVAAERRADLLRTLHRSWKAPSAADDMSLGRLTEAITITKMTLVLVTAAGSPSYTWTVKHGTDRSAAGTAVVTAGTVTTSITTGSVVTVFNSPSPVAASHIWLESTAMANMVAGDEVSITIEYVVQEPAA